MPKGYKPAALTAWAAGAAAVFAAVVFLARGEPAVASHTTGVSPFYTADAYTRLFDDFEGTTLADSLSATVDSQTRRGYLSDTGLFFPDTAAHAVFADSWWAADTEGFQESGTIEFYFKLDTFVFTSDSPYQLVFTQNGRPSRPEKDHPQIGFFKDGPLHYEDGQAIYDRIEYDPIHPGQWYHIAITWGPTGRTLWVNGDSAGTIADTTFVAAETWYLGVPPSLAQTGRSAVGTIDRFRLSTIERSEFPVALSVVIDTPQGGETVGLPFVVKYRAFASETRPRLVDLYADTGGGVAATSLPLDGNEILLASDLPESGAVFVRAGLADTDYTLIAVARAGSGAQTDSAYFVTDVVHLQSALSLGGGSPVCLATRAWAAGAAGAGGAREPGLFEILRRIRDVFMETPIGRLLASWYYFQDFHPMV